MTFPGEVESRARAGRRANLAAQSLRLGARVLSLLVMSRLLGPEEFGAQAMAQTVLFTLWVFRDGGLAAAAVQAAGWNAEDERVLSRAGRKLGLGLAALGLLAALPAASFYRTPEVAVLIAAQATGLAMPAWGLVARVRLARGLRLAEVAWLEAAAALAGTAAMLVAAWAGAGALSFAAAFLAGEAALLLATRRRARRLEPARGAAGSGDGWRNLAQAGLARAFLQHLASLPDTVVVARVGGAEAAGIYSRAQTLAQLPLVHVAAPQERQIEQTLPRVPVEVPGAWAGALRRETEWLAWLLFPAGAVVIAIPAPILAFVLGEGWTPAAPALRWLMVAALLGAAAQPVQAVLHAQGRGKAVALLSALTLPVLAAALLLGAKHGVEGVALALAATQAFMVVPRIGVGLRGTPIGAQAYLAAFFRPGLVAIAAGAAASALERVVS